MQDPNHLQGIFYPTGVGVRLQYQTATIDHRSFRSARRICHQSSRGPFAWQVVALGTLLPTPYALPEKGEISTCAASLCVPIHCAATDKFRPSL